MFFYKCQSDANASIATSRGNFRQHSEGVDFRVLPEISPRCCDWQMPVLQSYRGYV
ncbi:hypothetical protein CI610_03343 [invertebrate metagenome]|uniref:Uncharacterized protein n=1 Tax=invertebrate metagenome TaxID=1711999 RepID=A0A2H9T3B9_9ZZZZ